MSAVNSAQKELVGATCNVCKQNRVDLGDHLLNGETPGGVWQQMEPFLNKQKWIVRNAPAGGVEAVCPICQSEEKRKLESPLEPFEVDAICPHCLTPNPGVTFCTGLRQACTLGVARNHIHRICSRCGFEWITATACQLRTQRESRWAWAFTLFVVALLAALVTLIYLYCFSYPEMMQ